MRGVGRQESPNLADRDDEARDRRPQTRQQEGSTASRDQAHDHNEKRLTRVQRHEAEVDQRKCRANTQQQEAQSRLAIRKC